MPYNSPRGDKGLNGEAQQKSEHYFKHSSLGFGSCPTIKASNPSMPPLLNLSYLRSPFPSREDSAMTVQLPPLHGRAVKDEG